MREKSTVKSLSAAIIACLLSACGPSSDVPPSCPSGQNCVMDLSLNLTGISPNNQWMRLSLIPPKNQVIPEGRTLVDAPSPSHTFICTQNDCKVSLREKNFVLGTYRLMVADTEGRFLGSGVIVHDGGDENGVSRLSAILDMETTGYYVASLFLQDLSIGDSFNFLQQLNDLTGSNSDQGQEMEALGKYFLAQGGADTTNHQSIARSLKESINQGQAPYQDNVPEQGGNLEGNGSAAVGAVAMGGSGALRYVSGPVGAVASMALREFVKSDAFKDDPVKASLGLLKFMTGMSSSAKNLFESGGATKRVLDELKKDLNNQTAAIYGLSTALAEFEANYNKNRSQDVADNFTEAVNSIGRSYDFLDEVSNNSQRCVTNTNGEAALTRTLGLRDYIDLFIQTPQGRPINESWSYNLNCLKTAMTGHFTAAKMAELRRAHEALTGDNNYNSLLKKVATALKNELVLYPNMALRGKAEARTPRPLSESYALYNTYLTSYVIRLAEANGKYASVYDSLFYLREQFPSWSSELYSGEVLSGDNPVYSRNPAAFPGANACHDAKGNYINLSGVELALQERCRFEMVMAFRAKAVDPITEPLMFTNDPDLIKYLPEGTWRDFCKVEKRNVPGGPVVLDFDGVNLWTMCSADLKQNNLPRRSWLIGEAVLPISNNAISGTQYYGSELINCSAFLQVKDYSELIWPKAYSGSDDTGGVAIACSLESGSKALGNWAISHINLARCGLDGSNPAKIGVDDGILQCLNKYSDGDYWNKYKLRREAHDTSGLRVYQEANSSNPKGGIIGFPKSAGSRSMFEFNNTGSTIVDRRGTDFGRGDIGGRRSIMENGTSLVFDLNAGKYKSSNIGDLLMNEMRYNKLVEAPPSDIMLSSFTGKLPRDLAIYQVRQSSAKRIPLLVYRRFAMGIGIRYNLAFGLPNQQGFSFYLRCAGDDSGCNYNLIGSTDNGLYNEGDDNQPRMELAFKNPTWGKAVLQRYGSPAFGGPPAFSGYVSEANFGYTSLTFRSQ